MVHSLIKALGLFDYAKYFNFCTLKFIIYLRIFEPSPSSRKFLEQYHSNDFLDMILTKNEGSVEELDSYGLVDDCSIFEGLPLYAQYLSGSVEAILKALEEGFRYVINWDGGRHHAQASFASGFCFINGINIFRYALNHF